MQKLSCKKKQATASSVEDARCWTSQGSDATCGNLHFELICMVFFFSLSYLLIYCDLLMLIDDRLTEDPRMHRAS